MKKLLSIIFVFILCFTFSVNSYAADFTVKLAAYQPENSNVELKVNITTESKLYTTEFYITYDPAKLAFIEGSAAAGDAAKNLNPYITATVVEAGKLKVSYTATEALTAYGTVCTLGFEAKQNTTANFAIEIDHAETFDGEHIRSLTFDTRDTDVHITVLPFWANIDLRIVTVVTAVVILLAVAGMAVAMFRKKKVK